MRIAKLKIEGFRGIKEANIVFGERTVIVGPNGCGKSTLIDALSLIFGRTRLVRTLTEHDFFAGNPLVQDRFKIVATFTDFSDDDPSHHFDWFRAGRGVPKWIDLEGKIHSSADQNRKLCVEVAIAGRFDYENLEVETVRYFHDDDLSGTDPFDESFPTEHVPTHLINDLGFFVLPARRGWEASVSFASDLFRRTVSNAAGLPSSEILALRDQLRNPQPPIEDSPALNEIVSQLNLRIGRLLPDKPKLHLRVTSGDAEGVLLSLLPHYTVGSTSLPASRHGSGLLSLQTLLLLLEIGRMRAKKGLNFILALEEPELHLAPGLQTRIVNDAKSIGSQTICTTHAARIANLYDPRDVQVLHMDQGNLDSRPLLAQPLPLTSKNKIRRLFYQNKLRFIEAIMHPFVIVPEGEMDFEWLRRLASIAETFQEQVPFSSIYGVAPTEDAAVIDTAKVVSDLRPQVVILVDGDAAGDSYALEGCKALSSPCRTIQWPKDSTIEDIVGWIIGDEAQILQDIQQSFSPPLTFTSLQELIQLLKTPNDPKTKVTGLKTDLIVHDAIIASLSETALKRAACVLDAMVCVALDLGNPNIALDTGSPHLYRFVIT